MHYHVWLGQPTTERTLRLASWLALAAFASWAAVAGVAQWTTRVAASNAEATLAAHSAQLSTLAQALPAKRSEAVQGARLRFDTPEGVGAAELTGELTSEAQATGARVVALRLSEGQPSAVSGAGGDEWTSATFECRATGKYMALAEFLDRLTHSRRLLEYTSVQMIRANADDVHSRDPELQLTLDGVITGQQAIHS